MNWFYHYCIYAIAFFMGLPFIAGATTLSDQKTTRINRLGSEKSPYLQQHQNNPIWWFPWGDEAFAVARKENKPIFLSIGYSTCHWCHVMEGDSFEKEEVAEVLNAHFISVKVDREERPDVDRTYMTILQGMNGSGGWPISMILTPEGVPFFGGTFIPRDNFIQTLQRVQYLWEHDRERILEQGQHVMEWLKQQQHSAFQEGVLPSEEEAFQNFFRMSEYTFDDLYGGFGEQMKFPHSMQLSVLLRMYRRTQNKEALGMVTQSLDAMARGGIYDQLGGGFHRYATDRQWLVPHFEKMLYDNALLAVNYLEAYQVTQNEDYARTARGILDYVLRDMTHQRGGFYSAEDADSEKTEGKFYVWQWEELKQQLSKEELQKLIDVYHVSEEGNWNPDARVHALETEAGLKSVQHANVLFIPQNEALPDPQDALLQQVSEKLLKIRETRIRPGLDDKILTSWNGLMITAMAKGYQVLGEERYLKAAQKAASFFLELKASNQGQLFRRWRDQHIQTPAYLDDYAFLIQALITLYQSDFDTQWVHAAIELQKQQDTLFWEEKEHAYYFADTSDPHALQREQIFEDHSTPAGNGVTALNLLQLSDLTLDLELKQRALKMLASRGMLLIQHPTAHAQMLIALDYALDQSKEIAIIHDPKQPQPTELIQFLHHHFLPNKVIALGAPELEESDAKALPLLLSKTLVDQKTTTYVCEDHVCKLPSNDFQQVQEMVQSYKAYGLMVND